MAQQTNQGSSSLITHGVCIGKESGNTDFCKISDGTYVVSAYDAQGTTNVGDHVQVYKSGSTYFVGQKLT